jgi:hypothetical protein
LPFFRLNEAQTLRLIQPTLKDAFSNKTNYDKDVAVAKAFVMNNISHQVCCYCCYYHAMALSFYCLPLLYWLLHPHLAHHPPPTSTNHAPTTHHTPTNHLAVVNPFGTDTVG